MAVASVVLPSTMLMSTDAAFGQKVVTDPAAPGRVRQALDVASGLNDGLAVPFFLAALDVATAELHGSVPGAVLRNAAEQIGWGLVYGRLSSGRGATTLFTEEAGGLLAAVIWIGFGASALAAALPHVTWRVVLHAALSLTLVRMLPVFIAMLRAGARRPTVAFMGWFGPRGLASNVFALLVVERGVPDQQTLVTTVMVTVGLNVLLHGLSSAPLVAACHRWYRRVTATRPALGEAAPATVPRARRQIGAGAASRPPDGPRKV